MTSILKKDMFLCRVSSVLNRDIKQFGKQYLFDHSDETCWNSDQGSPQWVLLEFKDDVNVDSFNLQFQGGFAASCCELEGGKDANSKELIETFYPEDNNKIQSFQLCKPVQVKCLRFLFKTSSDFFGRITLYRMEVFGS